MTDLDYDDDDDYPVSSPSFDEFEDEQAAKRGTSECDGLCLPLCNWCSVAHMCPNECAGGVCPYAALITGGKMSGSPSVSAKLCADTLALAAAETELVDRLRADERAVCESYRAEIRELRERVAKLEHAENLLLDLRRVTQSDYEPSNPLGAELLVKTIVEKLNRLDKLEQAAAKLYRVPFDSDAWQDLGDALEVEE
jgi:hypothetical protein